jgi:hypothetical protein
MGIAMATQSKIDYHDTQIGPPICAQSNLTMNLVLELSLMLMMGPTLEIVEW